MLFWALWMLGRMFITGSLLRKLPYVPTRYQQLSYRFFGLQVGVVFFSRIEYVMCNKPQNAATV